MKFILLGNRTVSQVFNSSVKPLNINNVDLSNLDVLDCSRYP